MLKFKLLLILFFTYFEVVSQRSELDNYLDEVDLGIVKFDALDKNRLAYKTIFQPANEAQKRVMDKGAFIFLSTFIFTSHEVKKSTEYGVVYFNDLPITLYEFRNLQGYGTLKFAFGELYTDVDKEYKYSQMLSDNPECILFTIKGNFENGKVKGNVEVVTYKEFTQIFFDGHLGYNISDEFIIGKVRINYDVDFRKGSIYFFKNNYQIDYSDKFSIIENGNKLFGKLKIDGNVTNKFTLRYPLFMEIDSIKYNNGDTFIPKGTWWKDDKNISGKLIKSNKDVLNGSFLKNGITLIPHDNYLTLLKSNGEESEVKYENGEITKILSISKPITKNLKTETNCEYVCQSCKLKSVSWTGGCLNGKINGKGKLIKIDLNNEPISTFEGSILNGKENGLGTIIFNNGIKYTGNWLNGNWQGSGTYFWADNSKYIGQFKDNGFNGIGARYWANGQYRSKGSFKDDNLFNGTTYFEDGTIEYTMINGTKKLSSSAEKIAQLEAQLENKRVENNNSRTQNNRNQEEQAKENWKSSPCYITEMEEKEWRSKGFSSEDKYKDYKVSFIEPSNKINEYYNRESSIQYVHITEGLIDREKWYWSYDNFNGSYETKNEALNALMKNKGCKSWNFK